MTFAQAATRYELDVLPRLRGKVQTSYLLRRLVERFGNYSLASITAAQLSDYRDERLRLVSPQSVVHELGLISRIFKAAVMDWGIPLPRGNPCTLVRKPALRNERDRRLVTGELDLLLAALEDCASAYPRAAVLLAIETAARQSELISMDWRDLDIKRRVARLRGKDGGVTKNGDEWRDVPLTSAALVILEELPQPHVGKVLPLSQNALQITWERAVKRARKAHVHARLCEALAALGHTVEVQDREIRAIVFKKRKPSPQSVDALTRLESEDKTLVDLHFHDLRHEATSRLAEKLQMHELMKVTGHKTSRMVSRYYHPRAEDLAKKLG
jgi:integrase